MDTTEDLAKMQSADIEMVQVEVTTETTADNANVVAAVATEDKDRRERDRDRPAEKAVSAAEAVKAIEAVAAVLAAITSTESQQPTAAAERRSSSAKKGSSGGRGKSPRSRQQSPAQLRYSRIFKKSSQDGNLVLFLPQREFVITEKKVEPLMGVALVHKSVLENAKNKVYVQVMLTFRYGREDEELMGLRFCNEIVVAAEQIYPVVSATSSASGSLPAAMASRPLLANSHGFTAVPFVISMGVSAPPSVRLLPCRPYSGAPIGTSYEVQLFSAVSVDEVPKRRKMVQMAVRLMERAPRTQPARPSLALEKRFMLSENRMTVKAKLDSGVYTEGDVVQVTLQIHRPGGHGVRRMRITVVQQVGVAMFSTGNFKNSVGSAMEDTDPYDPCYNATIDVPIELHKEFSWVAMDENPKKDDAAGRRHLAPSVVHATRSMFIIRVQYYVNVQLFFGMLQRPISLKLPFLMRRNAPATPTAANAGKASAAENADVAKGE